MTSKAALRKEALARRDALAPGARTAASLAIRDRGAAVVRASGRRRVGAYLPIRSECDPRPLIDLLDAADIEVALPAIVGESALVFRRHRPGDPLIPGPFRTLSPPANAPCVEPDLVMLPVVAFDRTGARLGYGRGFYDRAIGALVERGRRPLLVGIAFAVQEVDTIPAEPHDMHLDVMVTEHETMEFRREAVR